MLHAQAQQYLVAQGSLVRGMNSSVYSCKFCAVRQFSSGPRCNSPAVPIWGNSRSRGRTSCAVFDVSESRLRRQGQGAKFPNGRLSSRPASFIAMANAESTSQPLTADNSSMNPAENSNGNHIFVEEAPGNQYSSTIALSPILPGSLRLVQLSVVDQAFLLLGLIACTASFALFALIVTAIPTFNAMRRAAVSVEKLADIAREELPGTMAAIRLSGMEISDLTLELNDLSQEISDGVRSSARAVQAAEVGLRRIGMVAASQTFAMLQTTASVPVQAVRPVVVSAAATTLHAVSEAQKLVVSLASSSYPRISGWLGQKRSSEKQQKPVGKAPSSTTTLTSVITVQETTPASLLSGGPQLTLFDDDGGDKNNLIDMSSGKEN